MPLSHAVILAIVQGLTEFLPISSSGHLFAIGWLLGWTDQGLAFDIAMHLGTLAAVILYFFRDWMQILASAFGFDYAPDPALKRNSKLLWLLMAATVPVGLAGLAFKDAAETSLRNAWVVGGMLILVGLLMAWGERVGRRSKDIAAVTPADAISIGVAQALAVVPGTSRSGITMTAGLFRDLDRPTAARFSFLLSTPSVGAAGAKAVYDGLKEGASGSLLAPETLIGMAVSGIVGWLVIHFLMRYLATHGFKPFIWYRIAFGILLIALAFFRSPRL